jgi:Tfp pilus assembly protein PilF
LDTLVEQARKLLHAQRWREAVTFLAAHGDGLAADSELIWSLGWAHFKISEYETAVAHLRRAAGQKPGIAAYHWTLAFALVETGDNDSAESSFKTALGLADSQIAWSGLALLYQRAGDSEAAEQTHQAAMERRPGSRERVEAYADFLSDTGRECEAREQYSRAAILWPESRREVQ